MYLADTTVLSKGHHPDFYDYMERMSVLAKRLYNAALFRLPSSRRSASCRQSTRV